MFVVCSTRTRRPGQAIFGAFFAAGSFRAPLRAIVDDRGNPEEGKFAPDSALEEAVSSEPVSEAKIPC